jgi:hypothetical protein
MYKIKIEMSSSALTQTLLLSIALETGFTFAGVVGRQVAALGIFNAFSSQFRILALVDIFN